MTEHATEGRRRSDLSDATARPAGVAIEPGAVADSIAFADDRLDRVDTTLNDLEHIIGRLTERLTPVLTDGHPGVYPSATDTVPMAPGSPEDRRSTIARRIADLGSHSDHQADRVRDAVNRLAGILDALEV